MRYILLTFNQDHGDEHDVPALACMTDTVFEKWKETKISVENPNYLTEKFEHEEKLRKWEEFNNELNRRKALIGTWDSDLIVWQKENHVSHVSRYDGPSKGRSKLRAYLGNNSNGFGESYEQYLRCRDLIDAGLIMYYEVTEEFHKMFHKADLSNLSMCNVFDMDMLNEQEDDEY